MSRDFSVLREKGLDVDAALSYTGGGNRYVKALTRFYNGYEKNRARIENSYNNRDYEDYAIVVHSLKSNARMIGDNKLGDLAEKLQYAGQDGNEELIVAETDNLLKKYKDLVGLIEPFVIQEVSQGARDASKIVSELKLSLEDYDYNKSIDYLEKLMLLSLDETGMKMRSKITEYIEEFQYEKAADVAGELINHLNR